MSIQFAKNIIDHFVQLITCSIKQGAIDFAIHQSLVSFLEWQQLNIT